MDKLLRLIILWGLPFLSFTDWLGGFMERGDIIAISRVTRATLLVFFSIYLFTASSSTSWRRFTLYLPLLSLGSILGIYSMFDVESPIAGLFVTSHAWYWMMGSCVIYSLTQRGVITLPQLLKVARIICVIAFAFTMVYSRTEKFETHYGASAYL
ncbi:MAG: hypothetical protein WBD31_07585, partial [Rubripirellula sp.]